MKSLALFLLFWAALGVQRFDGYSVLRLKPTKEQLPLIQPLHDLDRDTATFWDDLDIRVTPSSAEEIKSYLDKHNIAYSVYIKNVQELVDRENAHTVAVRAREALGLPHLGATDPFFDDYRNLTEINNWLDSIAQQYPSLVIVETIGTSYEGRPIRVAKVTTAPGRGTKPTYFWEGGIHAREWIAPATMAYMISMLVTNYGTDSTVTNMLTNSEFHIVVVVNPDGYEYTWTQDREWRKTRSPNTPRSPCIGTDPNRNWDDHWCDQGGSNMPCSDSYCGSKAFSESEPYAMAQYVLKLQGTQKVNQFIDYHSYGQLFMAPYGWTATPPPDAGKQETLGNNSCTVIQGVNGMYYEYGRIYVIIYPASGSSADWVYTEGGVTYAYGIELRDTGEYGFLLPADQIVPQGNEIWASLKSTWQYFQNTADV